MLFSGVGAAASRSLCVLKIEHMPAGYRYTSSSVRSLDLRVVVQSDILSASSRSASSIRQPAILLRMASLALLARLALRLRPKRSSMN